MRVLTRLSVALLCVGGAAASTVLLFAGSRSQGGAQLVIRAVGSDGQPVTDLKPADLTVRIDGKNREIRSLELVQPSATTAATPATAAAPAAASPLPSPYATNRGGAVIPKGAREFIIAIDDEGIAPGREQPVRAAVEALLQSLGPGDAVGLAALKSGGTRFAPTTDHASVRAALAKIVAMGSANESANDMGCRTKTVIAGISGLLQDASPARTVVVFSGGVATPTGEAIRTELGKEKDAMAAMCQVHQRDLDELGRVASGSAAGVYIVFVPEALGNQSNRSTAEAGLDSVAGVTGGEMIRLIGAASTVARIGRTAGTYYLATVDEAAAGARRIDARVSRQNVRVVARPLVATAAPTPGKAVKPQDMIRSPAMFRDVPLRAAGFVSRQPAGPELKVVVLFEPDQPAAKLTAASVGLFDQKGSLKAQWTARPEELARSPVVAALAIAPGKYRVRVAANDANGNGGTTDMDLPVELIPAGPLKMGTMVLVGAKGMSDPKLAFSTDDALAIGLLELYGVGKEAKVDVTFEIARDLTGEAMGSGQGTVAAGQGEDARLVYGGFPVTSLEPGDYVLRAIINVDGQKAGVATRTIRKLK